MTNLLHSSPTCTSTMSQDVSRTKYYQIYSHLHLMWFMCQLLYYLSSSKTTISAYPCQLEIQKLSKNQELPFDLHQPIYSVSLVKITFIYFNLVFYSFTEGAIFKCVNNKTISKNKGKIIHELMRSINILVFFTVSNINLSCFEKEWA